MASWEAGTNDSYSRAKVVYAQDVIAYDQPNNRTLIRIQIGIFDNNASYGGYGTGSWSISFMGAGRASSSVSYDFAGGGPGWVWSGDFWVGHDGNGYQNIYGSASFSGVSPVGSATASGNFVIDYTHTPGTPAAPSLTRNSTGTSITATSAVPSSFAAITDYNYRFSVDNVNWSGAQGMGTGRVATFTTTATSPYYVQTRAFADGVWGAWSPSGYIAGVPSAPSTVTATRQARNVTVTAGTPTSDGGSAITGYFVQYTTDGSTWSSPQAMTSQSYTYTSLPAALTYTFRVYTTNSTGNSATTSSAQLFVPAGGRRWDGTDWVSTTTAKRWDGSAWVDLTTAKRWDGTTWTDLS